jgi:hypothetical protein
MAILPFGPLKAESGASWYYQQACEYQCRVLHLIACQHIHLVFLLSTYMSYIGGGGGAMPLAVFPRAPGSFAIRHWVLFVSAFSAVVSAGGGYLLPSSCKFVVTSYDL